MSRIKIYTALVLAMVFWSLSFVWVKVAYNCFSPMTLVFFRVFLASAILFLLIFLMRKFQPIKREHLRYFILLGFFEPFLYFIGESHGMKYVSSTLGAVIISTIPLFTPIVSYVVFKEKVGVQFILGLLISLFGVSLLVFNRDFSFEANPTGILLMFLAVLSAVFYPVFLKKLTDSYYIINIVFYQHFIGTLFFLPVFFVFEVPGAFVIPYTSESIYALFKLAIFASVVAFILFSFSVRGVGVSRANVFVNLIPALTAIFAYFIQGEHLDLRKIIGIIIVISGLYLGQFKIKKSNYGKI